MRTRGLRQATLLGGAAALAALAFASACGQLLPDDAAPSSDPDTTDGGNFEGDASKALADGAADADSGTPDAPPGDDVVVPACAPGGNIPRVFLTADVFRGDYLGQGGVGKFDTLCTTVANQSGWQGTFRAYMDDGTASAADRMGVNTAGWARPDGTLAVEPSGTDQPLRAPINVTEKCTVVSDNLGAWTGIGTMPFDCTNWSSASFSGSYGDPSATDDTWRSSATGPCNVGRHLYCFQLLDP